MKLLLIEDEKEMAYTLKERLSKEYVVELAFSGEDGEYLASVNRYNIIILDLLLPDIDGITVCTRIRNYGIKVPILMLTGEYAIPKKVMAFNSGVDDYLVKPFHFEELLARVKALLRRNPEALVPNMLTLGSLQVDLTRKTVIRDGKKITLKKKEFQLLEYFMRNVGTVITRDMFLEHMWDSAYEVNTNIIDVHINYLRHQLDKPFEKKLIKTVYGFGYKMEA